MESFNLGDLALIIIGCKIAHYVWTCWRRKESATEKYIRKAEAVVTLAAITEDLELELEDVLEEELEPAPVPGVKRAKRVKHGLFRSYLVQQGKAKFGTPKRSTANVLVVRKYLADVCFEAGLLTRHTLQHLDIATALVFVPSKAELTALAIAHTVVSRERSLVRDELGLVQADIA